MKVRGGGGVGKEAGRGEVGQSAEGPKRSRIVQSSGRWCQRGRQAGAAMAQSARSARSMFTGRISRLGHGRGKGAEWEGRVGWARGGVGGEAPSRLILLLWERADKIDRL